MAEAIVNAWGVTLPEDAAPLDQQFIRIFGSNVGDTPDFAVGVYKRPSSYMSILSTPLVRLDKNFDILPGGALSWEPSEDGKTWTFHLNPALTWSDQSPVTADDVVFTMQYMADPVHAWDFAWFWSDLVNFDECVAGTVPAGRAWREEGRRLHRHLHHGRQVAILPLEGAVRSPAEQESVRC